MQNLIRNLLNVYYLDLFTTTFFFSFFFSFLNINSRLYRTESNRQVVLLDEQSYIHISFLWLQVNVSGLEFDSRVNICTFGELWVLSGKRCVPNRVFHTSASLIRDSFISCMKHHMNCSKPYSDDPWNLNAYIEYCANCPL